MWVDLEDLVLISDADQALTSLSVQVAQEVIPGQEMSAAAFFKRHQIDVTHLSMEQQVDLH